MKGYKFLGTGNDENYGLICFPGAVGDSTLCGYTLDGDSFTAGKFEETSEKVNCPLCIQIVEFCKTIKKSEYTK